MLPGEMSMETDDRDMVVRFEIQDTGIKCGDTSATLTGQISNGPSLSVQVQSKQYSARSRNKLDIALVWTDNSSQEG